jgi:rare lipoprotein A
MFVIVLATILFLSGCGGPKRTRMDVPQPPGPESPAATAASRPTASVPTTSAKTASNSKPNANASTARSGSEEDAELLEPTIPANTVPLATETGLASWYGPPYHNRKGSNGEVYNMHAMTAAHRTFPLGSIVRVTNVKTGATALVRITDRGPFIPGRVVDLSLAAAHKLDVYQPGTAQVKVELLQSSAAPGAAGKWAVQIGGFPDEHSAGRLADHLTHRYRTAKVLNFESPAGDWWIRVRVLNDDHERAQKLADETRTSDGAVFLVRLD